MSAMLSTGHDVRATRSQFFKVGGALDPLSPSYLERTADTELYEALQSGEPCYVLDTRQMGKSSLIARVGKRLKDEGAAFAFLDISGLGQTITIDQWYVAQLETLGQAFGIEPEINAFIDQHERLGPVTLWSRAIRDVVVKRLPNPRIVIVVDEIDFVRSLPFPTDEFFTSIREMVNSRSHDEALHRLTFCLLGVATPPDLIRGDEITPFNLGRRIELTDFTADDARRLTRGLHPDLARAEKLLDRILYWTDGHPYLTQSLCAAVVQHDYAADRSVVDAICEELFFVPGKRDQNDNLRMVAKRFFVGVEADTILGRYQAIRNGDALPYDATDPLTSVLKLSGIAKVVDGHWVVRNRIYERVFDDEWIRDQLTPDEVRRQEQAARLAVRKARNRALMVAGGVLVTLIAVAGTFFAWQERGLRMAEQDQTRQLRESVENEKAATDRAKQAEAEATRQTKVATENALKARESEAQARALRVRAEQAARDQAGLAADREQQAARASEAERSARDQAAQAQQQADRATSAAAEADRNAAKLAETNRILVPLQLSTQSSIARAQPPNLIDRAALLAVEALGRGPSLDAYLAVNEMLNIVPSYEVSETASGMRIRQARFDSRSSVMVAAVGADLSEICAFDLTTLQKIRCGKPEMPIIFTVNPDAVIGVANGEQAFRTWELKTGLMADGERIDETKLAKANTTIGPVSVSPDGKWDVRLNPSANTFSIRLKTSQKAIQIKADSSRMMPLFSPGSNFLFVAGAPQPVIKLQPDGSAQPALTRIDLQDASAAAFSPDEQIFAKASSSVTIWTLTSNRMIATLPQTDRVSLITFSPDSKFLAVAQPEIDSVRVFERNGVEVARVNYPGLEYGAFTGSPASFRLMTAGGNDGIRLWDIQNWPPRQSVRGNYALVGTSGQTPFLGVPLSAADTRTIRIRDTRASGPPRGVWYYPRNLDASELSPDARRLAVLSLPERFDIFDVDSGKPLPLTVGRPGTLLGFGPDGASIALHQVTCSRGQGCLTIFDAKSGGILFERSFGVRVWGRLTSNGQVHVVTERGALQIFNAADGQEIQSRAASGTGIVTAVTFDQSGETAVIRRGGTLTVWETKAGVEPRILEPPRSFPTTARLELSPSGRHLVGINSGGIQVLDLATQTIAGQSPGATDQLFFTPDERRPLRRLRDRLMPFANATQSGGVVVLPSGTRFLSRDQQWAVTVEGTPAPAQAGQQRPIVALGPGARIADWPNSNAVLAFAIDPQSRHVAFAYPGRVELFELESRKLSAALPEAPVVPVQSLAFADNGRYLIAATDEVVVWDTTAPAQPPRRGGTPVDVTRMTTDASGRRVAFGRADGSVEIVPVSNWRLISSASDEAGSNLREVAMIRDSSVVGRLTSISPDGRVLAAAVALPTQTQTIGTVPRAIRVWDADTGKMMRDLSHDAEVLAFAFSPSGSHLASVTPSSVRIWQTSDWRQVGQLAVSGRPTSISFSLDGTWLSIASDGLLYVTPWRRVNLIDQVCQRISRKRLNDTESKQFFFEGESPVHYCDNNLHLVTAD